MIYLIYNKNMKLFIIEYIISLNKALVNSEIIEYPENICNYNESDLFVYFGISYVNYKLLNKPNIYLVNLEQLTIDGTHSDYNMLKHVLDIHRNYPLISLLDYSMANSKILEKYNIVSRYLPYQVNESEIYNYEKQYDYVMCCSYNERTNRIYSKLAELYNKHVFIGRPCLWGSDRDNILLRSKILMNVHHREFDYNILEEIRITRCILNKVIVISEDSQNKDLYPLSKYVLFCKYEDLVSTCTDVLNNYEKYYKEIYNDFNIELADKLFKSYIIKE